MADRSTADVSSPTSTTSGTQIHHRACNLCEAICGLEIRVENGSIVSIRGDAEDPLSRGHICPKAVALQDIHADPDRLRHPMRRTGDSWERIPWDEAFDLAADRIRSIQDQYGNHAVGAYLGNPNVHNYGSLVFGPPLLRALRTPNRYSATSVDQLPHHLAAYWMFGHQLLLPIPDLDRTDYLVVLGGNPAVSNGSIMTSPDVKKRLKEIRQRGGKVVVVDPRRTETAKLADRHLFVRPGSDAFLLAALVHTLFDEGLVAPGHLESITDGFETVREAVSDLPPERVSEATGIASESIRELAREVAAAPSAAFYGRLGVSVHPYGSICQWLVVVLNVLTGNLDRPGGMMFTRPAADLIDRGHGGGSYGRWKSRVRGLPEFGGELPVSALAEEILTPGEGQIRALVTSAGNPVLSTPGGQRLDEALRGLDFMVSIDFYINETTRHAHLILPPTAALEHDHYDLVFHMLAIRNTARYSPALFEPAEDTRHDWQILHELRKRLDRKRGLKAGLDRFVMGRLSPARSLDLLLRQGPYGKGFNPFGDGLSLARLQREPHGVDLGPLEPCLPGRLRNARQRIDLAPQALVDDLDRLRSSLNEAPPALVLIGRRQVRTCNSWFHNYPRLMRGEDRCTLLIHPDDAGRLGLEERQKVRVCSRVGEVEAPVEITETIMPGVVSLPHGFGHGRNGARLQVANQHPGVSVNDLTDPERVDAPSGNAVLNGVPVTLAVVDGDAAAAGG